MNGTKRSLLFGLCLTALVASGEGQQLGVGPTQPALSVLVPVDTANGTGTSATVSVSSCCGGTITTLAGNGTSGDTGDGGPASAAEVTTGIRGIAADAAGDVFFVDDTNATVRVVYQGGATAAKLITAENPSIASPVVGDIYVIAGTEGSSGTPANGTLGSSAHITPGAGLSLDAAGDVYFNDTGTNKVWIVYAGGTGTAGTNFISIEAGVTAPVLGALYAIAGALTAGGYTGDGSLATSSTVAFHGVNDMKFDTSGNMYIVDQGNQCIREVNAKTGIISTVAGGASSTGVPGAGTAGNYGLNGPAINAQLNAPYGVAVDPSGNIYIADKSNLAIKMVYVAGTQAAALIAKENPTITTPVVGDIYQIAGVLSGNQSKGTPYGDLGTSSPLSAPTMVALDAAGNIYIADNGYNIIQEINGTSGVMVTVAGNGTKSYGGDGGLAINAEMAGIRCVAVDAAGRLYITDATNERIREVSPPGIMSFVGQAAGTTSAPETIQLVNTGNATLTFTGTPVFGGANANDFAIDSTYTPPTSALSPQTNCALSSGLASGATCVLALTYAPTNSGTSAGTLTFTTNGALSPLVVSLQGQLTPALTTLVASATTAYPGEVVTLTATAQSPVGTPTGTITFYQGTTVIQTATTLPSSGVITITLPALNIGAYTYTAVYSGDTNFAGSTSAAVTISVDDFSISASPTSLTVVPGQGAQTTLTVTGSGPSAQTLSLSCTAPSTLGCAFTPSLVSLAAGGTATVNVEVAAVATTSKIVLGAFLPFGGLLAVGLSMRRRRSKLALVAVLLCLSSLGMLSGCSENNIGTPLGGGTQSVTVNVSGTGGPTIFTQSVVLTVNVQ